MWNRPQNVEDRSILSVESAFLMFLHFNMSLSLSRNVESRAKAVDRVCGFLKLRMYDVSGDRVDGCPWKRIN